MLNLSRSLMSSGSEGHIWSLIFVRRRQFVLGAPAGFGYFMPRTYGDIMVKMCEQTNFKSLFVGDFYGGEYSTSGDGGAKSRRRSAT